jgi:hypothetical protein
MAHISEDRVLETSTSTGTGTLTLAGAVTGYRTFASQMAVADTCLYAVWAVDGNGAPTGEWEAGVGTYSATNTLTRTTVLESSNAGSVVTLSAGTKYVAITLIAAKSAQFDNVGAMWVPAASTEPGTPATGNYLYAKQIVPGDTVLKVKRPNGVDSPLQDAIGFNKFIKYQGGAAIITAIGAGPLTAITAGTSVASSAGTTIRNALLRTQYATTATANTINALYANNASSVGVQNLRGSLAGEGGFRLVMRFGLGAVAAGNRFFGGLRDVVALPTNIDPFTSTTPGGIGLVANTATDANWRIAHNVSGTAPTNISLGANFPVNATDLIELVLFCRPFTTAVGDVGYRVRRYTTTGDAAFEATGTLTGANLPAAATFLYPTMWMVNVAASVVNWQVNSITLESDF